MIGPEHETLTAHLRQIHTHADVGEHTRVVSWLPFYHDMGLIGCLLTPVAQQRDLWLQEPTDFIRDPARYLACFSTTRSEIVVPIFAEGQVIGEIDIDGSDIGAYDETDARFLEEVAALLAPLRQRVEA